jgi:hypothetical protein
MADQSHNTPIETPQTRGLAAAFKRWAEAHGARFSQDIAGSWRAIDKDGALIVTGAMSKDEAARLYCEDKDITPGHADAILARIFHEYRPYESMSEFREGYRAYQLDGGSRRDPYETEGSYKSQAWSRGANAALLYQRAMEHLNRHPEDANPETAALDWLVKLLRGGR